MNKIIILFCLVVSHNVMSSDSAVDLTTEMRKLSVKDRDITSVADFMKFGALDDAEAQEPDKLVKKVVGFAGFFYSSCGILQVFIWSNSREIMEKNSARCSSSTFAHRFGPRLKKWGKKEAIPGVSRRIECHPRRQGPLTFEQLVSRAEREEDLEEKLK